MGLVGACWPRQNLRSTRDAGRLQDQPSGCFALASSSPGSPLPKFGPYFTTVVGNLKSRRFSFFFYERCSPSPLNVITARCLGDYFNGDKKYSCMGRKMVRRDRTTRIQRNVFSCPPPFPQPPNNVIFSSSPFVRAHFPCKEIKSAQLQFMQQGDT